MNTKTNLNAWEMILLLVVGWWIVLLTFLVWSFMVVTPESIVSGSQILPVMAIGCINGLLAGATLYAILRAIHSTHQKEAKVGQYRETKEPVGTQM